MKPAYTRRRHRPATTDIVSPKKDNQKEQQFFGEATHEPFFKPAAAMNQAATVQRKCADCEKEDKVQRLPEKKEEEKVQRLTDKKEEKKVRKKEGTTVMANSPPATSNYINSINGKGQSMNADVQSFYEGRMGADFSNVKIHTGKDAYESAKDLNAQAYAYGNHIVFNEGKYQPESSEGKKLLAHELTHVIQQNGNGVAINRSPDDKHDLTSEKLAGDPTLEKCFDNEAVVRKPSKGPHVKRLQEGLIQLGISIPKFGADGDYGSETENAVKDFQQKAQMSKNEWDGIVGRKTIGLMDMSLRNNTISKDEDVAANDFVLKDPQKQVVDESCKDKPKETPCPDPNTAIDSVADQTINLIDKVVKEQLPPVKSGKTDYPAIFSLLFRFNDTRDVSETVNEVRTNFEEVKKFVGLLKTDKTHVRCGTDCDGGCRSGSPAYHAKNAGIHVITFCPDFNKRNDQHLVLMHESHHAAISGSKDIAYPSTRLVEKLDHSKALRNAASFHLYAGMVDDPGSVTIGPAVKDKNSIKDNTAKDKVDLALAFIEQWFNLITFDMSEVSTDMSDAHDKGHYLSLRLSDIVDMYHKWFGTAASPVPPSKNDVTKAKAIEERSLVMEAVFDKPFNIQSTSDASVWERGPGTEIKVNSQLADLDINRLVIGLLQQLVHATPDISAETEPLYVGVINDIRNRRSLDP